MERRIKINALDVQYLIRNWQISTWRMILKHQQNIACCCPKPSHAQISTVCNLVPAGDMYDFFKAFLLIFYKQRDSFFWYERCEQICCHFQDTWFHPHAEWQLSRSGVVSIGVEYHSTQMWKVKSGIHYTHSNAIHSHASGLFSDRNWKP